MPALRNINHLSRNIVVIFLFIVLITKCQDKSSKKVISNQRQLVKIENIWTKLGDTEGKVDNEMDIAVVEAAEFSPNGDYILSGSRKGKNLRIWDTNSGEIIFDHKCNYIIKAVTFSRDNKYFLAGGENNKLFIWKVEDWSLYKEIEFDSSIESIRFNHSGNMLAVGDQAGIITLMKYNSFIKFDSLEHRDENYEIVDNKIRADVNSIDFSKNDAYLISGGINGKIKIWFLPGLKLIKTINAHTGSVKTVRINHQRNCFASSSSKSYKGNENSIKIWDFESGDLIHTLTFPTGVEAVEFTPDGRYLFGGGNEVQDSPVNSKMGHIYTYYIPEDILRQPIKQIHEQPVFRSEYLHVNETGEKLVSSHEDGSLRLWNIVYY